MASVARALERLHLLDLVETSHQCHVDQQWRVCVGVAVTLPTCRVCSGLAGWSCGMLPVWSWWSRSVCCLWCSDSTDEAGRTRWTLWGTPENADMEKVKDMYLYGHIHIHTVHIWAVLFFLWRQFRDQYLAQGHFGTQMGWHQAPPLKGQILLAAYKCCLKTSVFI